MANSAISHPLALAPPYHPDFTGYDWIEKRTDEGPDQGTKIDCQYWPSMNSYVCPKALWDNFQNFFDTQPLNENQMETWSRMRRNYYQWDRMG